MGLFWDPDKPYREIDYGQKYFYPNDYWVLRYNHLVDPIHKVNYRAFFGRLGYCEKLYMENSGWATWLPTEGEGFMTKDYEWIEQLQFSEGARALLSNGIDYNQYDSWDVINYERTIERHKEEKDLELRLRRNGRIKKRDELLLEQLEEELLKEVSEFPEEFNNSPFKNLKTILGS